jgi:hypothetical protein
MKNKTLKQLFPEMKEEQRKTLGHKLSETDLIDVQVDPKVIEDGNKVRLYHPVVFDKIILEAVKLFGNHGRK